MKYTLTATLHGKTQTLTLEEDDTFHATLAAIGEVLNRAVEDIEGPWSVGAIELIDEHGNIVHQMASKV